MENNPDSEFRTSFIHIIILSNGCLHKQGHWPTSGSGKDVGCCHTVLSDVNLKSYFCGIRRSWNQDKMVYKTNMYRLTSDVFWSAPRYPGWSCWNVCKFVIH